ncbi:MAG: DoxX family membrane protein [Candidatus Aureabacteria bacterium]|jgi:uncharacterized membrane protein YphA (DoxX/SURF4 family)|nr:DoxX family membrane protein [Candidatus Auribacterota bacterium]NLW93390.1 DoxX family membrane protein [Chlamydiota bacterium]HOE27734.1 MauE/DoxX family redox-associated membrane protein [bacterium]HQM51740.1 MauE/DoxX family redox-associated membrane protein [bacterium]
MSPRAARWVRAAGLLLARLFLGGLFVYASLHKLADPVSFSRIVYGYKILPPWAINLTAIVLPGVELAAGALLLAGLLRRGAALAVSLSLLVFICALAFNLARGLDFDCGCFSFARTGPGAALDLLVRDVVFLALSCWVLLSPECPCSADRLLGRDA